MQAPRFRVYWGPQESSSAAACELAPPARPVHIALADLFAVLSDALANQRSWVHDFAGEEVAVSSDLYEVILAYRSLRRPSA